jgi:hypothetical protein
MGQTSTGFFRRAAKVTDWLGFRLTLLLTVGLVGFAILQPFIWEVILNRKAPALSNDFAGITTIIVTIMALAFAGFGVVVYQLAEKHSEASLQERARELEDNILMHGAAANSKLYINISYQAFLSYDELWRRQAYSAKALEKDDKSNWELLRFLDSAIDNARQALKQYLGLSEQLRSRQESADGLINCRCNYAYFLATRLRSDGRINDRERALDIARQLDQDRSKRNLHVRETVAWVYLRCCDPGDSLWERGLQDLALALNAGGLDVETLRARYTGVFGGKDGKSVPVDLEKALTGKNQQGDNGQQGNNKESWPSQLLSFATAKLSSKKADGNAQ